MRGTGKKGKKGKKRGERTHLEGRNVLAHPGDANELVPLAQLVAGLHADQHEHDL